MPFIASRIWYANEMASFLMRHNDKETMIHVMLMLVCNIMMSLNVIYYCWNLTKYIRRRIIINGARSIFSLRLMVICFIFSNYRHAMIFRWVASKWYEWSDRNAIGGFLYFAHLKCSMKCELAVIIWRKWLICLWKPYRLVIYQYSISRVIKYHGSSDNQYSLHALALRRADKLHYLAIMSAWRKIFDVKIKHWCTAWN